MLRLSRFYFHIRSQAGLEPRQTSIEFDSLEDAIADAKRAGAEMFVDEALEQHRLDRAGCIEVAGETGTVVATIPFDVTEKY